MRYAAPRARTCRDCGRAFTASAPCQKRCPACQRAALLARRRANALRYYYAHRKAPPDRACPHCGRTFSPRSFKQLYCSDRCTNLAAGARWRKRNGAKPRPTAPSRPKPESPARPAPARDWMRQVELDLQIVDPGERFKASARWSAKQRAYAQKLALRAIGWRGAAH